MAVRFAVVVLLAVSHNVAMAGLSKDSPRPAKPASVCVQGSWAGIKLIRQLIQQYESDLGSRFITFGPRDSDQVPGALEKHECDVGMMLDSLVPTSGRDFEDKFEMFPIGRFVVHVAVNARNSMHTITLEELRDVFSGKVTSWGEISHARVAGRIELYGPLLTSTESSIFQKKAMQGAGFAQSLRDQSTEPGRQRLSTAEIIGAIGAQSRAIGFFLQADEKELDKRVRILKIARDKNSKAVAPSVGAVSDGSYPLWDTLTLYLHPDAPPAAREFCKFASGAKAVKIVKQFEMWPEHELERPRGKQNAAELKRGKAETIRVCDLTGSKRLLNDLAVEFMKVRTAVQLSVQVSGEARAGPSFLTPDEAERRLLADGSELLLVESAQSAVGSGKSVPESPRLSPESPARRPIVLGRMAVGIIVHPKNRLDALPLDELQGIFGGEIKRWPGAKGAGAMVHVYGLRYTDPIAQLLQEKMKPMTLKHTAQADSAKVAMEVATDPFAIGFVDLSQLSPDEKSVKLVDVFEGTGARGQGSGSRPHPGPLPKGEGTIRSGQAPMGSKPPISNPQSPIPVSKPPISNPVVPSSAHGGQVTQGLEPSCNRTTISWTSQSSMRLKRRSSR